MSTPKAFTPLCLAPGITIHLRGPLAAHPHMGGQP